MKKYRPFYILVTLALSLLFICCGTYNSMHHQPDITGFNNAIPVVKKHSATVFSSGNNFLLKNKQDLWELYVEGDPLERGLLVGSLSDSLLKKQETVFFSKINDLLPSKFKQKVLRSFLKWYNRKLYLNVPEEFQTEIYGVSKYSSPNFDNIASPYLRSLYLHGAHDIGHALQDLALVGCSSFAAWGDKTEDGSLILGRNFDFYAGDDFAKDKIVAFVNPKKGHPFMMVTWAGMIGAVSGMNKEGLTVTINAGKSKIPLIAKTPISILTREILQYAKNIDEAIAIAKKRKVFVSESIMVGSANDKKAILIEVSPDNFGVYEVQNTTELICTNHFQSDALKDNKGNINQIKESHSKYRYDRLVQLLDESKKLNPAKAANILRNKDGLNNLPLGYGNEKALNQLLAHHGIIFKPEQRLVWVSSNPYQLGEFVCYDLNKIFNKRSAGDAIVSVEEENLNIAQDPFVLSKEYKNYELFRIEDKKVDRLLENKNDFPADLQKNYQSLNPDYWVVYYKMGMLFYEKRAYDLAKEQFEIALTKEITTLPDKENVLKYLKKSIKKVK
ncbi:C45 family autoproteolytic acyltransferase/hydolase [Flavobacterium muglaense]|uniref:Acyl-CoA--6-aminopenicillanic acid acyl-transferase n=1 Tax=Flavobacterium muglaense TaxID=2764716 RepID=A0A923MZK2_9FLAO|nr:C45 family peptidase [Flavobacterium muglaense]MBC5837334.1 acyl-CoA--6-aminopenicillanic acid acyl-transferase [Flavobacterium muglaense]MBC5843934.1 acyl-CoA--6-aminopenicillanic acid acyl-transferase [Flavobacterium muglaense]